MSLKGYFLSGIIKNRQNLDYSAKENDRTGIRKDRV